MILVTPLYTSNTLLHNTSECGNGSSHHSYLRRAFFDDDYGLSDWLWLLCAAAAPVASVSV